MILNNTSLWPGADVDENTGNSYNGSFRRTATAGEQIRSVIALWLVSNLNDAWIGGIVGLNLPISLRCRPHVKLRQAAAMNPPAEQ